MSETQNIEITIIYFVYTIWSCLTCHYIVFNVKKPKKRWAVVLYRLITLQSPYFDTVLCL